MKHRFLKMAEMENKNPYLIRRLEESSGYFGKSFSSRYSDWKRSYSIRNAFYRELTTISFKEPIKVLDLGYGDGWLTYRLKAEFSKKYKLKFFGVDLSQLDIEFANHRKRYFHHKDCYFQVMDAQYLGFDNETFDIIISSELVEHIPEPHKVIREVYRILKKGGLFILTTPHKGGGLLSRVLRLIKERNNTNRKSSIEDFVEENEISKTRLSSDQGVTGTGYSHISVKSKNEWIDIFKNEGFKITSIKGTSGFLFGSPYLDNYRILFAITVILDTLLEKIPLSYLWAETLFFELRKR